jgi:hypothetical protein
MKLTLREKLAASLVALLVSIAVLYSIIVVNSLRTAQNGSGDTIIGIAPISHRLSDAFYGFEGRNSSEPAFSVKGESTQPFKIDKGRYHAEQVI